MLAVALLSAKAQSPTNDDVIGLGEKSCSRQRAHWHGGQLNGNLKI